MNPTKLGPYELDGILGRGGMGTVYRAKHFDTNDIVAVKALSHSFLDEPHFRQRFESEIKALLKLDHPNIVRLISYGQDQGVLFFAMELVEGKSLFHLLREVKIFDWRDVLVIAKDVTSGLRHAHDRGIIHRDLKPGNLLKSKEGLIKVTDFGIAKSFGTSHDTRDNVVGTIDYMSPEQALGRPVTVRSDLYSLGVVLYTLLAGQTPFNSNSIEQSLRNLTSVPAPKIRTVVPNAPELLEELIGELLEKRPERRTPTSLALLRKLEYIENELRDHSEAKTAHGLKPAPGFQRQDTFRLGEPLDMLNQKSVDPGLTVRPAGEKTGSSKKASVTNADAETAVLRSHVEIAPEPKKTKPHDYFSTVTDQQRRQQIAPESPSKEKANSGWFLILLGLVAAVSVAVVGIYYATKPPTADQLFNKIEMSASQPEQVRDELSDFLRLYSEDKRAEKVQQLQEIANASSLYQKLYLRRNLPGNERLSQVEKQFVEIIDDARENVATGFSRLDAFIILHDSGEETIQEIAELVAAAKAYRIRIKFDARNQFSWDKQRINEALDRAADDPANAADIYRSVIKLYEDIDWAEELVTRAKNQLSELE